MSYTQKKRVTVEIYGQQYAIIGEESEAHIFEVAKYVDMKMREIGRTNPTLDTNRLAVLTAVNVVHEYIKLKEEYKKLKESIEG
ncbi:MAG: cell division protein ZapA [Bacillaceae bacterium]